MIGFFILAAAGPPELATADSPPHDNRDHRQAPPPDSEIESEHCSPDSDQVCRFYKIIVSAARRNDVEPALVMAIIQTESRYDPKAVSPRGAQGLMQLMPRTAEALGVMDSFDPEQNVDAGVRYFKRLLEMFAGDRDLALAAYNAGAYSVLRHGGIPPFPSTRKYIRKVRSWYDRYKSMVQLVSASTDVSMNQ